MTHGKTMLLTGLVASILGVGGSAAKADSFDFGIGIQVGSPQVQRVWVEPVYETRCDRVWIEPVYETRCERVWREPVYELRESKVWVPDRFEVKCETYRDGHGRRITREVRVLVERGHWDCRQERVVVRAGCWDEVPQQVCVREGRWEQVEQRVIVRAGYWQDQVCDTGDSTSIYFGYGSGDYGHYGHNGHYDKWDDRHGYENRRNADYRPQGGHDRNDQRSDRDDRNDRRENVRRDDDRRGSSRNDDLARDHDKARQQYEKARENASRRYEGDRKPRA